MNIIILSGRIGKEPELFTFTNGTKKTNFTLAVSENYKDKNGEWKESTDWFNIVLFHETNLKKGDYVELTGKLKIRSYEDKDGTKRYVTEIIAKNIKLLSRPKQQQEPIQDNNNGDDLPFE